MNQTRVCMDLGTKATFFGLGLLASKKMRPYAKYFIVGGLALSAAPVVMQLVEEKRLQRFELEELVDEVAFEDAVECEEQECTAECAEADASECTSTEPCAADTACEEEEAEQDEEEVPQA